MPRPSGFLARIRTHAKRNPPHRRPRLRVESLEARLTPVVTARFATLTSSVTEGIPGPGSVATIQVLLDAPAPAGGVQVGYAYISGSGSPPATPIDDFTPPNAELFFPQGESSETFTVGATPDSIPEQNEQYQIGLIGNANVTIDPNNGTHTVTILDDDSGGGGSQPVVSFVQGSVSVNEAAGTAILDVQIDRNPTSTVTVPYQSANGTATAGLDYTTVGPANLTFTPGGTRTQQITVPITDDTLVEGAETFAVNLGTPTNAVLGSVSSATVTIIDNDPTGSGDPQVFVASANYSVGEAAGSVSVTVSLSAPPAPGQEVTVNYATSDGSATDTLDYQGDFGTIRFAAGSDSQTINIPILDDTLVEGNETFAFTLSNASGATIKSPSSATVTIIDDDTNDPNKAIVQFDKPDVDVLEDVGQVTLTVRRTGNLNSTVTAYYNTGDLTAVAPDDYTAVVSGSVTLGPGLSAQNFQITIINDNIQEELEHFKVTLTSVTADTGTAALGDPKTEVVGIVDDDLKIIPMPKPDCGCGGDDDAIGNISESEGRNPENRTTAPVRYQDGTVSLSETDISSIILDAPWGHTRSWTNNVAYLSRGGVQGNGWVTTQLPYLVHAVVGSVDKYVVVSNGTVSHVFDLVGGNYVPQYYDPTKRVYDAANQQYVVTDTGGNQTYFLDFGTGRLPIARGAFGGYRAASGTLMAVISRSPVDGRIGEVQQQGTVNGQTVTESFQYAYIGSGENAGFLRSVTLRRKIGTGPWQVARQAKYTYYPSGSSNGRAGDLKTATILDETGKSLGTEYYRYWTANGPTGYPGGLKYVFTAPAYARLARAVANPNGAADTAVSPYADNYFEYDSSRRVTKEIASGQGCSSCSGGQGTFTYAYTTSLNAVGFNNWATKTVETLPDGSIRTAYTNAYGQVMLTSDKAGGGTQEWVTFNRYDTAGRLLWTANPSAFAPQAGKYYDDTNADLLNLGGGNSVYLNDSAGLITSYVYGTSTTATTSTAGDVVGYWKSESLKKGELGTAVPQAAWTYLASPTVNGVTVYRVAAETRYRNADGTGGQTTTHAYTYISGTTQVQQETITYPTVTTAENGPNSATSTVTVFDLYGRPVWAKDQDGFINYTEYDPQTGGVVKQITDVNTALTADFIGLPTGWSTPAGGGLHLKTLYEVDDLGRTTKTTYPNGRIDYTVYLDSADEVRTYVGWNSTTNQPTGPTMVSRTDKAGGYTETLSMTATPDVAGGRPTGTEAIGGLTSLSRQYVNPAGQTIYADQYFNLVGVTYSTAPNLGTQNANFYRTTYSYDALGRPDKTVTPAGTIHRTVYDFLGRVSSEWVGTNDTPASGYWSPTNNTAPANMTKVSEYVYDDTNGDGVGDVGDGDVSHALEYPTGGPATPYDPNTAPLDTRRTDSFYDWRDRQVAVKSGVETRTSESATVNRPIVYTDLDNLGEAIQTRQFDGDGVTVTDANGDGVPDAPAAGLLRAQSTTSFDELGREYLAKTYSVDPATGAVATNTLKTNTWYDKRGEVIKVAEPGGLVTKTAHDGAGRATVVYLGDGLGDSTWADASSVVGNVVLEQTETGYDANGNVLTTTVRQRFHDNGTTGALGTPTTGNHARVSYTGFYYDLADRLTDSVDVGTNGGTAWTRPGTVPARSDTVLVTSQSYDPAGRVRDVTDPKDLVTRTEYDDMDRPVRTTQDYVDGVVSDADDKTVEYDYSPAGQTRVRVVLPVDGQGQPQQQTTETEYGVFTTTGDGINSFDIPKQTEYPDPTTGLPSATQADTVKVNALGETVETTDRNGTVHDFTLDVLGRLTADTASTLGTGIDSGARRIDTAYDGQGNAYLITTYADTAGTVVSNQVQRDFNGLGQLSSEWQSTTGVVVTVGPTASPRVRYAYSEMAGGANHSRPISMTYPNLRVINYLYDTSVDGRVSRVSQLGISGAAVEGYDYLGLDTVVQRGHNGTGLPGVGLYLYKLTGEPTGDGGDQYTGLDRFGRVADQRWIRTSNNTDVDRYQYAYDRDSNRTSRTNVVHTPFNETYAYDGLNQLTSFNTTGTAKSWAYDAVGNWNSVTTNGVGQTRTHNKQNEILTADGQATPTYDAAGNQTTDFAGRTFTYDAWNRTKTAAGHTYSYDGLGRRVRDTLGATATDLYYSSAWQLVEERVNGATTASAQYVWAATRYPDELVLRYRDADGSPGNGLEERLWAMQDANYNVTGLMGNAGTVVERNAYDPYGQATVYDAAWAVKPGGTGYGWNYLFQGLRWDGTTGKLYARNRDYDPAEGRWTRNDPKGFDAGDVNWYRAFANNSVVVHDPTGLGDGHHWVPVAVVMDDEVFPFLSKKALYRQAGSVSGATIDSEGKGHMFGSYGDVQHSEYNKIVKEEICKFIKEKGITKDNKMTDEQMKEFVDRISSGKGSSRSNSRKLLAFNSAVMKQVIKPIPTDDASVMRRGQALVRNSSRYVAIAAVASITTFLTDSAKALDVMAESNHFKGAIRQAQQGNLAGTQQEIMGDSAEDLDGQDLFGDLVRGGVDRRFAYRIKIEVDKYFAQIAQKRNAIDALRD